MKRFAQSRWSPLLALPFLALPVLPLPACAQSAEVLEREAALRLLQERLARIQEQMDQVAETEQEAKARYEQLLFELQEAHGLHLEEAREMARKVAQEEEARAEFYAQEARRRTEDFRDQERRQEVERRVRLEQIEQERSVRLHEIQQERQARAEELRLRVRQRLDADRSEREARVRDLQQVVVRLRARARLGVTLDGSQGEEYDRQGALIKDVAEDSPAMEAGLREGDIITHLDGKSLLSPIPGEEDRGFGEETSLPVQRLMALARELEDGQEVEVRYVRAGEALIVTLKAAKLGDNWVTVTPSPGRAGVYMLHPEGGLRWRYAIPDRDLHLEVIPHIEDLDIEIPEFEWKDFQLDTLHGWSLWKGEGPDIRVYRGETGPNMAFFRSGESPAFGFFGARVHGLEVRKLNPDLGEYFSTDRGVLVLDVEEGSGLGLLAGDVILSIGDRTVEGTDDVFRILESYKESEAVTFTVMRKGRETRVEGTIG